MNPYSRLLIHEYTPLYVIDTNDICGNKLLIVSGTKPEEECDIVFPKYALIGPSHEERVDLYRDILIRGAPDPAEAYVRELREKGYTCVIDEFGILSGAYDMIVLLNINTVRYMDGDD